jgi:hypothetical protein
MDILKVAVIIYCCFIITVIVLAVIIFFYVKYKRNKARKAIENKTYKYKNYKLKLVRNTLGVKKSHYWLLKVKFREIIEAENKALGFEYIKPFDFTKLRENVTVSDVLSALVVLSEKKDLLPQIFSLFVVDSNKYVFDYEKDYNELSVLAGELLTDFFYENLQTML